MAVCTAGRAAMRSRKAAILAKPEISTATKFAPLVTVKRVGSGTLKGSYRWSDAFMTYASAARGYKAGGFNLDRVQTATGLTSGASGITPVNDTSFPGEFVDSYELGAKSTLAGGNLLLNAAYFHQTFTDFQLNTFNGLNFVLRSVRELTSQGQEHDLML